MPDISHPANPATTYAQTYLPRFQAYQHELVERLATLVNIDSGTGQVEGVNRIMAHLQQWLDDLHFTVTLHARESFGYNLLARRKGKGRRRLLLVGHVDTVYAPGSAQTQPFTIREGIAYGPGVIDMKSGIMLICYALRALTEAGFEDYAELCVVFNNDEEVGSPGSASLLREIAPQVDIGLVLESSGSLEKLTHARKGVDTYKLEVYGIPAHSGAEPHKGRSAVIELAHKMLAIHNLNALSKTVTFNVTRISSSEPLNIIPDVARCSVSVRARNQYGLDMAADALGQIAAGRSVPDTKTTLTRMPGRPPYEATPELMQLMSMAQAEWMALGLHLVSGVKGGVSDANLLMSMGIPTLDSLGPIGGNMHNLQLEHLRLDSIPLRGALLAGLIQHICQSDVLAEKLST